VRPFRAQSISVKDLAVKIVVTALLVGSLGLAGATGSYASATTPPLSGATPSVLADATPNSADRKAYVQAKATRLAQWRSKISDFAQRSEAKATEAGHAAKLEIEGAWAHVEEASRRLDAAGESGWEDAKTAYERALRDLETTWAKDVPAKT
jgi:hypothetical protein